MSIYLSTHQGVAMGFVAISDLSLTDSDLRGYFSRDDITELLLSNQDSVGIRFYNVNPVNSFPSLLAVNVTADGHEMVSGNFHFISSPINSPSQEPQKKSRSDAFNAIRSVYSAAIAQSEKFSSFFSRTMLQGLMTDNNHSGVAFYKVPWLGGRSTLLAISSDLDDSKAIPIKGVEGAPGFSSVLSDQPCPGHCSNVDSNGNVILSHEPLVSSDLERGPYIPIWDL